MLGLFITLIIAFLLLVLIAFSGYMLIEYLSSYENALYYINKTRIFGKSVSELDYKAFSVWQKVVLMHKAKALIRRKYKDLMQLHKLKTKEKK